MFSKKQSEQFRQIIREEVRRETEPINQLLEKHDKKLNGIQKTLKRAVKDISFIAKDFDDRIVTNSREMQKLKEYQRRH